MLKQIILLLVVLGQLVDCHGFIEWQTGLDRSINGQKTLSMAKNYPINLYKDIVFPRRYSRIPKVLLMNEELQWNKNQNVDFFVHPSDITVKGFKLNYHLGSRVNKMQVRWVAILDQSVEIQYVNYGFQQLNRLRQGRGRRVNQFVVQYGERHYPTPTVIPFLVGVQMDLEGSVVYNLDVKVGRVTPKQFELTFRTRDKCKVRSVRVALLISHSKDVILGVGGAAADQYNKFQDTTNKVSRRHEVYERKVPFQFKLQPHMNILAQGIVGFDAHAKRGDFAIKVGHEYIKDQLYRMSFGTQGNTVLLNLHFAYVLRTPALPPKGLFAQLGDELEQEEDQITPTQETNNKDIELVVQAHL